MLIIEKCLLVHVREILDHLGKKAVSAGAVDISILSVKAPWLTLHEIIFFHHPFKANKTFGDRDLSEPVQNLELILILQFIALLGRYMAIIIL